jgi:hypothetical protein
MDTATAVDSAAATTTAAAPDLHDLTLIKRKKIDGIFCQARNGRTHRRQSKENCARKARNSHGRIEFHSILPSLVFDTYASFFGSASRYPPTPSRLKPTTMNGALNPRRLQPGYVAVLPRFSSRSATIATSKRIDGNYADAERRAIIYRDNGRYLRTTSGRVVGECFAPDMTAAYNLPLCG